MFEKLWSRFSFLSWSFLAEHMVGLVFWTLRQREGVLISCEHLTKLFRRFEFTVFGGDELPLLFIHVSWGI